MNINGKKGFSLTIIAAIISINTANADYMARIPLEKATGGSLPDNSIRIGGYSTDNDNDTVKDGPECLHDDDNYYLQKFDANNNIIFKEVVISGSEVFFSVPKGALVDSSVDGEGNKWKESKVCYTVPETGTTFSLLKYEWSTDYVCNNLPSQSEIEKINLTLYGTSSYLDENETPAVEKYVETYRGSETIPIMCETKKRIVLKIEQNTKTFETNYIEMPDEIVTVESYSTDETEVYCSYSKGSPTGIYIEKWVVDLNSAFYYHSSHLVSLPSKLTVMDTSVAHLGEGFWARGKFMETDNTKNNYAVCYWGAW